jgi:hypothetical protein
MSRHTLPMGGDIFIVIFAPAPARTSIESISLNRQCLVAFNGQVQECKERYNGPKDTV